MSDGFVTALFFLVLLASPLPMGGNRDWAWAPMVLAFAFIAVLVAFGIGTRDGLVLRDDEKRPMFWLIASFAVLLAMGLFQIVPLLSSPPGAAYFAKAAEALGRAHAPVISLAIDSTVDTIIRCVGCGLVFLIARALCADERRGRLLLIVLVASAVLVLAYAFIELSSHSCFVGSFQKKAGVYRPEFDRCVMSGTFVNSNSFSCFLGMSLIAALGLAFSESSSSRRRAKRSDAYESEE
ncbi:MAG TPA: hypothetical protein VHV77_18460, partial [Pirellulales bacterium]|nr:hypothetical protein [Pirellulales bacterium]